MQYEKAKDLRRWNNGKLCSHDEIDKEYYLGSQTGDYVCTSCGKTFSSKSEWESERKRILEIKKEKETD